MRVGVIFRAIPAEAADSTIDPSLLLFLLLTATVPLRLPYLKLDLP